MKPDSAVGRSKLRVRISGGDEVAATGSTEGKVSLSDEVALVARCRTGDTQAFRTLVDSYQDRAYRLALRILRSPADAEEVAQDAFVRAWSGLRDFRGEAAFSTWLYRIVARRALDRVAVLRGRRGREAPLMETDEPQVAPTIPVSGKLAQAMEALPETQRAVVALFYYEDHSVSDVARVLALPEGTVKTHLSRARALLRKEWMRREGPGGSR